MACMAEQAEGVREDTGPGAASRRSTGRAVSIARSFCHLERDGTRSPRSDGGWLTQGGRGRGSQGGEHHTAIRGVRMARA